MPDKLSYPPVRNPNREINKIIEFFQMTNQPILFSSLDKRINSIKGGRTSARIVLQTDPMRLNNNPRLGTSSATTNVISTMKVLKINSPKNG